MARNFPFDTQRQKALMELYEKEATAQLDNYMKSQHASQTDSLKTSKLSEALRKRAEHNRIPTEGIRNRLPQITMKRAQTSVEPKCEQLPRQSTTVTDNQSFGMQPPNSKVRSYLYSGFSKEGKGRIHYLRCRNELSPEDKYSYPMLSSWSYGWGLSEYAKKEDAKHKRHGRTKVIEETFYARNGIPIRQLDGMLQRSMTIS